MPEPIVDNSTQAIEEALTEALEVMAFITPMPPDDSSPPLEPAILTRVEFNGERKGALEMVCSDQLGAIIVANLLGVKPEHPEAVTRSRDALRELINVTCGTLLRKLSAPSKTSVEMAVPTQRSFDLAGWQKNLSAGAALVDAEGQKLALRLVA